MDHEQKLPTPPRDAVFAYYPAEDLRREEEIHLVDLWLVLVRRRAVFFTVAGLILAAGIAYALLAPPKYRYSALIELGSISTERGVTTVEGVSTALAKIEAAFVPAVLADYLKAQPAGTEPPEIRASIPKGSETLMLTAQGTAEEGETLLQLQAAVTDRLAEDHARLIDRQRHALRENIAAAKHNLETLATNATKLDSRAERIEELAATLQDQRNTIAQQLDAAIALERSPPGSADDTPSYVTSQLRADVETRTLREQLRQLDQRIAVDLPKAMDDIRTAADSNVEQILAQQERIADLESRLADVRDTRAIRPPARSLEPSGPSAAMISILATGLALLSGISFALLYEVLNNVRAALVESRNSKDVKSSPKTYG